MERIKATALKRLSSEPEMDSNCDSCLFCIDFKMSDDCVFGLFMDLTKWWLIGGKLRP